MGRALGEEAPIVEILAPIPPKIASPIEDRHLRRCLSYKEVKEEVEWEARNKTNVDLFRDTYQSTVVPAHCTASQLSGIVEDLLIGQEGEGRSHPGRRQQGLAGRPPPAL